MTLRQLRFLLLLVAVVSPSCVGTTGGELRELRAYAAGPADPENARHFSTSLGYEVTLEQASVLVGGVYLNRSRPVSVSSDTSCSLPGIYVAEVLGGLEVDLLSGAPQAFPSLGFATSERALTGEVWLTNGNVNQVESTTRVLRVAGLAERGGARYPFAAELTIGENRLLPAAEALPGQHPICKQRVVSPIELDLKLRAGEALLLRIEPRYMFANVDFETLTESDGTYRFADEPGVDQASDNLYAGLHRAAGVYTFSGVEP